MDRGEKIIHEIAGALDIERRTTGSPCVGRGERSTNFWDKLRGPELFRVLWAPSRAQRDACRAGHGRTLELVPDVFFKIKISHSFSWY